MWISNGCVGCGEPEMFHGAEEDRKRREMAYFNRLVNELREIVPYTNVTYTFHSVLTTNYETALKNFKALTYAEGAGFPHEHPDLFDSAKRYVKMIDENMGQLFLRTAKEVINNEDTIYQSNNPAVIADTIALNEKMLVDVKRKSPLSLQQTPGYRQAVQLIRGHISRLEQTLANTMKEQKELVKREQEVRYQEAVAQQIQYGSQAQTQEKKPNLVLPLIIGGGALATILALKG